MHRLARLGLRAQLSLLFSLFALSALLLLGTASARLLSVRTTTLVGGALEEVAVELADDLARTLDERLGDLRLLSRSAVVQAAVPADAVRSRLESLREHSPAFLWVGLLGTSGAVSVGSDYLLEGANLAGRPWFQDALERPVAADIPNPTLLERSLLREGQRPPQAAHRAGRAG